jgi:tRNA A-37 threonylcarbamoyl transferase component Bud32
LRHSTPRTDLTTPPAPAPDGAVPAFANGSLIDGKYLVEETVAEGGIGIVVVAKHLALDQRVAIKYLKPAARENPSTLERFVREGRLAAQIASDHVVRVLDVGSIPEGGPYIVMEYLVGEDLGHVVRRGPVPVSRAVDYMLQACDALAAAHALRIVHRDIKPENLFLAERASNTAIVKVVDFGISKVAPERDEAGRWAHETADGERFGTPLYMSPEQLRSTSSVDPRTDVWSFGVTLHELITGSLPFEGNDLPQLCTSILTGQPIALTTVRPDAPPLLEAVILRCLEKDPDLRFQNLAELAQELAPFGFEDAGARVKRIRDVILGAGEVIRPPTPGPGTIEIRPSLIAASLARAQAMTTGERAATMLTPRTEGRIKARRRTAIAWAGALACVAMLAMASVRRAPAAAPAEAGRTPIAAAALVGPSSLTGPTADSAAVGATPTPVAASATPSLSASAAHGKPAASSRPLPTPSSQRRALFGDRK